MYKNLYKWDKVFASGSVAFKDTDECADGAQVTVSTGGAVAGEGVVNNYGEFVVDKLEPGKSYTVKIEAAGYKAVREDRHPRREPQPRAGAAGEGLIGFSAETCVLSRGPPHGGPR